jgi:hypothetical protein
MKIRIELRFVCYNECSTYYVRLSEWVSFNGASRMRVLAALLGSRCAMYVFETYFLIIC